MTKPKDLSLFSSKIELDNTLNKANNEELKSKSTTKTKSPKSGMQTKNSIDIKTVKAEFCIGDQVQHKLYDIRGIIVDVDPEFSNTEEWYNSIPEKLRPRKDQPFYHLLAEGSERYYSAYVSQQNLLIDDSEELSSHPSLSEYFERDMNGRLSLNSKRSN